MGFRIRDAAWRLVGRAGLPRGRRVALIHVGTALLLLVVLAIGVALWDLRRIALSEALVNTDNLAVVLAEQTNRSVQAVDLVLREVEDRIGALGVATPEDFRRVLGTREMHEFLRGRKDRLPQVDNIALVGADGIRVNYTVGWPVPAGDMSDRDYFHHFATADDRGLFISQPVINRATYVWSIYVARRVDGPHGEFLGMVLGSVPLTVFQDLYRSIGLPDSESLMLLRRDGTVLARHPDPIDRAGAKMPRDSPWYATTARGGGFYESHGVFDTVTRLVAVRVLRDYPLVMNVTVRKDTALAHWRREATLIACGTIGAAGSLLLLLRALGRQFRRLENQRAALLASEARLVATSRELETTLASMDQGLVMVDAAGVVAVCNRRAIELLALPAALMTTRPHIDDVAPLRWLHDAIVPVGPPGVDDACLAEDRASARAKERSLPDGRIVEVRGGGLAHGGGWMATLDDITARRQAEQQVAFAEAESRAKSGFLAMMSHEIRTPLNGVLGLAGTLFDTPLSEEQHKTVVAIQDSGNSLLRILNDILDFSKLDAGQMQLEETPFSPATLTHDPVSLLGPQATARGLVVNAVCDHTLPEALLGDAGRLRQVLLNLVSNAIKFTQEGAVTIRAVCTARDETAATMVWTVTDTGIGIAPDRLDGLFREFFQADASITRRFGGSGLGLAISKRLIGQMGGTITVSSRPGAGSTFTITLRLPITAPAHAETMAPHDVAAAFAAWLRQLGRTARILLAEDNPTNQFVILQLLRGFDVQVDVAANGLEAVRAASGFRYDVICMDMRMPEMDGLAATRAIRAMGGPLARVPIIALTANAFPEDATACSEAGMNSFLAKPVGKQSLLAALLLALAPAMAAGASAPRATADAPVDDALCQPDFAALRDGIGEAGVAGLVALFERETIARLGRIGDPGLESATRTREVHTLKGAAGAACALALARRAAALEIRLRQGGILTAEDLPALTQAFEAWREAVRATLPPEAVAA